MANPNIVNVTQIYGKTTGVGLTTTSATSVLNNAVGSGKCLKINTLNVSNYGGSPATISISWYNAEGLGGSAFNIVGSVSIPANATLNVIDKSTQYYLEENTSLGATTATANTLTITCSYEEIS